MTTYKYQDKLESNRLVTRFLTIEDIYIWADFYADKDAVEFFPSFGLTTNIDRARHMIEKQLDRYTQLRFGHQALIDKKTNSFIGVCGLLTQEVDGITEIEVGYHILKKYWGQGYAPEAAKLFINYAFDNNITNSIISVIDTGNIKSQKVADKNGLTREKQTKYTDHEDVYIYRIKKKSSA
jgi:RimJ/RimL family protein N-acetyltransferase